MKLVCCNDCIINGSCSCQACDDYSMCNEALKELEQSGNKDKFKQLRKLIADGRFVEALQMIDNELGEK